MARTDLFSAAEIVNGQTGARHHRRGHAGMLDELPSRLAAKAICSSGMHGPGFKAFWTPLARKNNSHPGF